MDINTFNALSEEEKAAYFQTVDGLQKQIDDVTAERDSFKSENASLIEQNAASTKELKATKELNFTLARKIDVGPTQDVETALYEFIKGVKRP